MGFWNRVFPGFSFVVFVTLVLCFQTRLAFLYLSRRADHSLSFETGKKNFQDHEDSSVGLDSSSIQSQRLGRLHKKCQQVKPKVLLRKFRPKYHLFLMEPQTGLAYCHVPKVASSFWFSIFSHMISEIPNDLNLYNLHSTLLKASTDVESLPENAFKMIFVRHPLKRLISAYVEKFVDIPDETFVADLKNFIAHQRKNDPANSETIEINFPAFVRFVIHEVNEDVVSNGTQHWIPYTSLCEICRKRIDFIGHLETLDADAELLSEIFPTLKDFVPTKHNLIDDKLEHNAALLDNLHRTREYLSQLDQEARLDLLELYKMDCLLFGYDCNEFMP